MKELEYPFYAEEIIKKRKSYKKFILSSNTGGFIDKRIAILGGRDDTKHPGSLGAISTELWD